MLVAANRQFYSVSKKQSENTTSQRPIKRLREDIEKTTPTTVVNQGSTAKITEESRDRNQNFLTTSPNTTYNTAGLAVKLNPLNPLTTNVPII